MDQDFLKRIAFAIELDQMKHIIRQNYVCDGSRRENDAEHSWHTAIMAYLFQDYAPPGTDIGKAMAMMLAHDLVEIYAGDTYCYDEAGNMGKYERELAAANRLYGLLPEEQGKEWMALWQEFEARETPEAIYAATLDRIQPAILNFEAQGRSWKEHGIHSGQLLERN